MDENLRNAQLLELANYKMPYGKFKGRYLVDLPEPYVVWLKNNALPKGKLGEYIQIIHEIKVNGLESIIRPLIR